MINDAVDYDDYEAPVDADDDGDEFILCEIQLQGWKNVKAGLRHPKAEWVKIQNS